MKAWDNIINAAMLGTDKPMPSKPEVTDALAETIALVDAVDGLDKEDQFLQKAAIISNYRRSGFTPLQKPEVILTKTEPETQPYCSKQAASVLNNILEEDNNWLLKLWLEQCSGKGQLLMPDVLPIILDKAQKVQALQPLVQLCMGKRGEWLSSFNPDWDLFGSAADNDELWQNGKPAERLKMLENTRISDPAKALQLVQDTWERENAATRADLLKVLKINIGPAALTWLEGLRAEKSVKVKDVVVDLLRSIPGSSIIKMYEDVLRQAVTLKKEKGLLGLISKTIIQLQLPANMDEDIFKTGIEKMVGAKSNLGDEGYIIYQLISFVPPAFWEKQFDATPEQVVQYFDKHAQALLPALTQAVIRFDMDSWVPYLLDQPQFYPGLFSRLDPSAHERYLMRFFKQDAPGVIHHALQSEAEWQPGFTLTILAYMADNPYQYNRGFFKENIRLINTAALSKLIDINPKNPNLQNTWEKTRDHLIQLLTLKQQTRQVFTA